MMLAGIREVAIGQVTVCVRSDVAPYVQCAGDGSSGQLGDGTTAPRMSFAPASIAAVTSLVAGWRHMVVRTSATQLHAWGNGTYGQLGRGDTDSSVSPVPIATALEQVTAGGFHTCGRRAGDGIECWGRSNEGQSGAAGGNVLVPTLMSATNAQRYIDLSAGQFHTCAVRDDGSVECWGQNAFGQLGGMSAGGAIPVMVMDLPSVRDVECGYYHCCALTEAEGELWCWGAGDSGQLGGGVVVARAQAGRVMGLGAVTQFATGAFHTCAVDIRSQLWCWGANESGQLGTGNTMNSETPVRVNLD
jgi:alpha-tubulin suppressor-like RCC1 family protein